MKCILGGFLFRGLVEMTPFEVTVSVDVNPMHCNCNEARTSMIKMEVELLVD